MLVINESGKHIVVVNGSKSMHAMYWNKTRRKEISMALSCVGDVYMPRQKVTRVNFSSAIFNS